MKTQQSWFHKVLFVIAWTLIVSRVWASFKMSRVFKLFAGVGVGLDWPVSMLWMFVLYVVFTTLFAWAGIVLYSTRWKQFSTGALRRSLLFTSGIMLATHLALIPILGSGIPSWAWSIPTFVCLMGSMMIGSKLSLKNARVAA